jgi:hypothetical protein
MSDTLIAIDRRVIVMMAALNIAGFDYEPGNRALSVTRQQLRNDLKGLRPELVQKIRNYFQSHRNWGDRCGRCCAIPKPRPLYD